MISQASVSFCRRSSVLARRGRMGAIGPWWLVLALATFVGGLVAGVPEAPGEDSAAKAGTALRFIEKEIPEFYEELGVLLKERPEMKEELMGTVTSIYEDFLDYSQMKPELAAIFLTIKRREFKNQLLAESLHEESNPTKRAIAFEKLAAHMNVTFDLNLKLVRGELAWLEGQVKELRGVVDTEKANKGRYLKEDLVALLLDNEPLLQVAIQGLGARRTAEQRFELEKLIKQLPPTVPENLPTTVPESR